MMKSEGLNFPPRERDINPLAKSFCSFRNKSFPLYLSNEPISLVYSDAKYIVVYCLNFSFPHVFIFVLVFPVLNPPHLVPCFQEPRSKGPGGRQDSPGFLSCNSSKLLAKNRQTFLLQTTKLTRIARRLCDDILRPQRAARRPYIPVNVGAIKTECKWGSFCQP